MVGDSVVAPAELVATPDTLAGAAEDEEVLTAELPHLPRLVNHPSPTPSGPLPAETPRDTSTAWP